MNEQTDSKDTSKRGLFDQCGFHYGPAKLGYAGAEWGYGYAPYHATDETYFGAQPVVDMEWRASLNWRHPTKEGDEQVEKAARDNLTGLALSGGGIRSASFSLGVMQALARAGWLKHIDYLSTVSGGGYIGSSFTWMLHKEWQAPEETGARPQADAAPKDSDSAGKNPKPKTLRFGMDWENFPYRTYPIAESVPKTNDVYSGRILRYLRQHARYLLPGGGLDWISLVAVVLRNTLFSLIVYGSLFVLVFLGLHGASQWTGSSLVPDPCSQKELADCFGTGAAASPGAALFQLAGFALVGWAVLAVMYIGLTLCFGKDWFLGGGKHTNYSWRYWYEKGFGRWPLIAAVLLAILGSVPASYHWLGAQDSTTQAQAFTIEATPSKAGEWAIEGTIKPPAGAPAPHKGMLSIVFDNLQWLAGVISTLAGVLMSLFAFKQTSTAKASRIPTGLVVALGSIALIFGFLLVAYHFYFWLGRDTRYLAPALVLLVAARFVNINYMSLHRYYRDRLMETFLPNVKDAVDVHGVVPGGAKMHDSDGTKLYEMCPANTDCTPDEAKPSPRQRTGPFHIINTNIVLVSSFIPKFRGRGGDNFILTPLCCGSNATGWCETGSKPEKASGQPDCKPLAADSPFESLTFASAMAISGAAVNPNTGVGGQGITRQPLLSFLMGILNIRLGYWASNPSPRSEYLRRIETIEEKRITSKTWRWLRLKVQEFITSGAMGSENALSPGLGELFLRRYLDENSHNIQLTDGGHFENLGLYELVRRRLKVIIVCDGAEDLNYTFCDLANAIEKVRADFGAKIEIDAADLEALMPARGKPSGEGKESDGEVAFSSRGYLVAPIKYTKVKGEKEARVGTLIYITTAFLKSHTADLFAYKKAHPEFPDQSTSDQFFDETQFEAYRELGFQNAHRLLCDDEVRERPEVKEIFGTPDISCPVKWRPLSQRVQPS